MEKQSIEKLMNDGYTFLRVKKLKYCYKIEKSEEYGIWKEHILFRHKEDITRELNRLVNTTYLKYLL